MNTDGRPANTLCELTSVISSSHRSARKMREQLRTERHGQEMLVASKELGEDMTNGAAARPVVAAGEARESPRPREAKG